MSALLSRSLRRGGPRVELLCVGTELLMGKANAHAVYFSKKLEELGLPLTRETTVSDDPVEMERVFRDAWARGGALLCTGGLGPTFDDVTREVWSRVTGRKLAFRPDLLEGIRERFRRRGVAMPQANRRQAFVLRGAEVLPNPAGTAPAQRLRLGRRALFLLPGPARELCPLAERDVFPWLKEHFVRGHRETRLWRLFGVPESAVDEKMAPWVAESPRKKSEGVQWGVLAHGPVVEVKMTLYGPNRSSWESQWRRRDRQIRRTFGPAVFGMGPDTLESVVGRRLREKNEVLAVVESCTGGLLGEKITSVPGSSEYFWGGWLTYDNRAKQALGVPADVLRRYGAVSKECALAMADAALRRSRSTVALAVTGVAGPGGGTPDKPVGRVFIGLASSQERFCWEKNLPGDRGAVREQTALWAMDHLRRFLDKPS